jgi:hypothetical protein
MDHDRTGGPTLLRTRWADGLSRLAGTRPCATRLRCRTQWQRIGAAHSSSHGSAVSRPTGQVQPEETLRVDDRVDFHDLAARDSTTFNHCSSGIFGLLRHFPDAAPEMIRS